MPQCRIALLISIASLKNLFFWFFGKLKCIFRALCFSIMWEKHIKNQTSYDNELHINYIIQFHHDYKITYVFTLKMPTFCINEVAKFVIYYWFFCWIEQLYTVFLLYQHGYEEGNRMPTSFRGFRWVPVRRFIVGFILGVNLFWFCTTQHLDCPTLKSGTCTYKDFPIVHFALGFVGSASMLCCVVP